MKGKVILVGAGPGDPGLLTLKGKAALESAEVVVYDRLVGSDILAMTPESAEKINVGKRASSHPVPQEEINGLLLKKAREGKRVVRLKGGDPFLFGRGGEELELLAENAVPFEVVPGIPSALSVPAYAGIPVTHRDCASSLHIITGHARAGKALEIDFDALVRTGGTLVFLMGVAALPDICGGLLSAGMPPETPAAVIERGTTPRQRRISGTVSSLVSLAAANHVESPAISIFGEVCGLAEEFDWFGRLPLKGKRIVVTRPKERMGTLSGRLRALGADVLEYPCIEAVPIEPRSGLETALEEINGYEWLAFTSAAGVEVMASYLRERKLDVRCLGAVKLTAIGQGTEKALNNLGLIAGFVPEVFDAEHLGEGLAQRAKGKVLILRAREASPELTRRLDAAGIDYSDVPVYETVYKNRDSAALRGNIGRVDYVTFTSASTVRGFVSSVGEDFNFSSMTGLCIGGQTALEARRYGIKVLVAERATIDSMIEKLLGEDESWI